MKAKIHVKPGQVSLLQPSLNNHNLDDHGLFVICHHYHKGSPHHQCIQRITRKSRKHFKLNCTPSFSFSIRTFFSATFFPVCLCFALNTSLGKTRENVKLSIIDVSYRNTPHNDIYVSYINYVYNTHPKVPCPIFASFSYLENSSQKGNSTPS